jgi:hypothetical protein
MSRMKTSWLASVLVSIVMIPALAWSTDTLGLSSTGCTGGGSSATLYGNYNGDTTCPNGFASQLTGRTSRYGAYDVECLPAGYYSFIPTYPFVTSQDIVLTYSVPSCDCYHSWGDLASVTLSTPSCTCPSGGSCNSPWSLYYNDCGF